MDPDKFNLEVIKLANSSKVSYFFIGGSIIEHGNMDKTIQQIRKISKIPIIIFPGDAKQISSKADAILYLSLVSGRNPDYLIGKHVESALELKKSKLEVIPTAYVLMDGGNVSTTQKVSKTQPVKSNDIELLKRTAIASEFLGMKLIYLEAGSGASKEIATKAIKAVKSVSSSTLLVGGGINTLKKAHQILDAGADIIVVGNALEKTPEFLSELKTLF